MAGEKDPKGVKQRKIPMRRCVGCGQSFPKKDLIRVVRCACEEGETPAVTLDFTSKKAGRGAYVCRNLACFRKARKAKRFETHLECSIPPEVYTLLEAELEESENEKSG